MISSQWLLYSLTAILVARFQLDLQAANRKAVDIGTLSDEQGDGPHSHSGTRSLIFERAVGSLAASTGIIEDYDIDDDISSLEDSVLDKPEEHRSISDAGEMRITEEHGITEVPLTA